MSSIWADQDVLTLTDAVSAGFLRYKAILAGSDDTRTRFGGSGQLSGTDASDVQMGGMNGPQAQAGSHR